MLDLGPYRKTITVLEIARCNSQDVVTAREMRELVAEVEHLQALVHDAREGYDTGMAILRARNPMAADVLMGAFVTMHDGELVHWRTLVGPPAVPTDQSTTQPGDK